MSRTEDAVIIAMSSKLVEPWESTTWEKKRVVRIHHASLLDMLRAKAVGVNGEQGGNAPGRAVVAKMPVAGEVALALAVEIQVELSRIVRYLGAKPSPHPIANMRYIINATQSIDMEDKTMRMIAKHLDNIVVRSETELGIRLRPTRLRGHCPECDGIDTIKVEVTAYGLGNAECTDCAMIWAPSQFKYLNRKMK